jgi:CRP/FNR family cyclic AMP-dependent transcriptional regulator
LKKFTRFELWREERKLGTACGEKLDIAELGPGDFFGEMAVLDSAPRWADVIALKESECLVLSA